MIDNDHFNTIGITGFESRMPNIISMKINYWQCPIPKRRMLASNTFGCFDESVSIPSFSCQELYVYSTAKVLSTSKYLRQ